MLIYLNVLFVTSPVSIQTCLPSAKKCNDPNAVIRTSVSAIQITMFEGVEHFERWKSILESGYSCLHLYSSSVLLTINPSSLQNENHVSSEFTKIFYEPLINVSSVLSQKFTRSSTKGSLNWSTCKDCNQLLRCFCSAPVI